MNTPPRYLRIAALVLLLAAGRVGPAGAAQAGGLPELSAQVKALQAAVAALQAAVVNLQNAPVYSVTGPSVGLRILARDVATLNVPAGQYWIVFTSTVTNTTSDLLNPTDTIGCAIVGVGSPNTVGVGPPNTVRLGPDANQAVMVLQAVANFSAPTTITVRCQGFTLQFSGRSENNVLTALDVGSIH